MHTQKQCAQCLEKQSIEVKHDHWHISLLPMTLLQDTGTYLYNLCLCLSAYANIDRNTTLQQYLMILTIRENVQWSISEQEEKSK